MRATVNGVERELAEGTTVDALLAELGATQDGLAIAVNQRVVRRDERQRLTIADGDAVEIVRAVAGG